MSEAPKPNERGDLWGVKLPHEIKKRRKVGLEVPKGKGRGTDR